MHVVLETERLILRRFTTDDVDNLVELDSDPDVMLRITGGRPTTREEVETDILPAFLRYYERNAGYGFWAAVERATGDFLGWFHFRPAEGHPADEPELGYRLRKSAWGKGYAAEGSIALIHKGFSELGVRRVVAETMVVHAASRRVMEDAGDPHLPPGLARPDPWRRARRRRVRDHPGGVGAAAGPVSSTRRTLPRAVRGITRTSTRRRGAQ